MLVESFSRSLFRAVLLLAVFGGVNAVSAGTADASLAGTHWRLVTLGGAAADTNGREPYIILDAHGRLMGGTGCNSFAGGYVVDGAFLTFGQMATTRMYCANVWRQERAMLEALPRVSQWRVTGDRLELIGGNGLVIAVFEAEANAN